jgi:hypothetical protein
MRVQLLPSQKANQKCSSLEFNLRPQLKTWCGVMLNERSINDFALKNYLMWKIMFLIAPGVRILFVN